MSKSTHRQFDIVFCALLVAGALVFVLTRSTLDGKNQTHQKTELVQLLNGNTLTGNGYAFYYVPDGTVRGVVQGYPDSGVWRIVEDEVCVQWKVWGLGKTSAGRCTVMDPVSK